MGNQVEYEQSKPGLLLPWVIVGIMLAMLVTYIIICQTLGGRLQQPLPEAQRVQVRTVFYVIAIMIFPLTNLIRHIQLRLNETMPCFEVAHYHGDLLRSMNRVIAKAKNRYLMTIIVSMSLVGIVGVFGLIMFVLGDGFNTLYLFIGMSALGLFLYRPKAGEYLKIIEAIATQKHE